MSHTINRDRIRRLERLLRKREGQVAFLLAERERLQAREDAVWLVLLQCDALLELGWRLQAGGPNAPPTPWEARLQELRHQLEAVVSAPSGSYSRSSGSSGGQTSSSDDGSSMLPGRPDDAAAGEPASDGPLDPPLPDGGGSAAPPQPVQQHAGPSRPLPAARQQYAVNWSPEAAAAAAVGAEFTAAGLNARYVRFMGDSAGLAERIRNGAPDSAAAERRLGELRADLVEHAVMTTLTARTAMSEALLMPLPGVGAAAPGPPPPPMEPHWVWAARQLRLDSHQAALMEIILNGWAQRAAELVATRNGLMAQAHDPNATPDEQEVLLQQVESVMDAALINVTTTWLPVFASVMRPDQFAAYIAPCAPWMPSLLSLRGALLQLRADGEWGPPPAQAAAAAAGEAAGEDSGVEPSG